jgi:uncharacterized protein (TIGR02996 family)
MDDFNQRLNEVIRYSLVGAEEFEKSIDENPIDAHNHLVYADWLDENGQPEEAEFRRSMGEWHETRHPEHLDSLYWMSPKGPALKWKTLSNSLPSGVDWKEIPYRHHAFHPHPAAEPHEALTASTTKGVPDVFAWKSYRAMETAFRKAFKPTSTEHPS